MTPDRARTGHRATALASLLLVAALAIDAGEASAHGADPSLGGGLFAPNQALLFSWRSGSEPPSAIRTAIRAAAADATATRASKAASFAYDAAGPNPIGYGSGAPCGVNGLACFTRSAPDGFTMWFREQGHVYDWGTLRWCQSYTTAPNGCYDAETIALDEFGHIEGLDHHINYADDHDYEDAVVQTFSRTKPAAGWNAHAFGPCDTTTLQRRYDLASWSTKVSTCQNLTTTLTLTASPAWVGYGASTNLTAVLRIAESDAYGQLSLDPLVGRTVSLQRRVSGTTAWIAAGTMSAGASSGTYVATARLVTGSEFRAVFAAPASEGLKGATAATFRVVVGGCAGSTCPLAPPAAIAPPDATGDAR
jgi:hypothetical protein